jgi:uncharacterized protein YraI
MKTCLVSSAFIFFVVSASPCQLEAAPLGSKKVTARALNVRSGPGTGYRVMEVITRDQVYPALEKRGSFLKLQIGEQSGWAHGSYLSSTSTRIYRVSASALNVRSGSGTQYRVLGRLARGAYISVRGANGVWKNFNFDGGSAWVHGNYLTSVSGTAPASPAPTATPAPATPAPTASRRSRAGFIQLQSSGVGFYAYGAAYKRWGAPHVVYAIQRTGRRWQQINRTRFGVGNISLENGGYMAPHSSHRRGVDVDIIPMRSDGREAGVTIYQSAYSRYWTQKLIDMYRSELSIRVILFNDSSVRGVQYWSGHDNHFHASAN